MNGTIYSPCSWKLLVCGIVVPWIVGCGEAQKPASPAPRGVLHERVEASSSVSTSVFSGVTQAQVDARLSFKVPGTVLERPVDVGDQIEAGTLLARLDDRDYRSAVQSAEAEFRASEARRRQAEANYERLISLYENRNTSLAALEAARAESEGSVAQVSAASEALRQAKLQLSYTRLEASEQCEVAETLVRVNENVDAGTPVVRLTCGQCPKVRVDIPQTRIGRIQRGQRVSVTVSNTTEQVYPATVSEVGVASASGATFPVSARFSGDCPDLRSGIAADVRFEFSTGTGSRVTVPSVAVGEDANGRFVFILIDQGKGVYTAQRRAVTVGELNEAARFVITEGLEAGEIIATAGVRRIQDGQSVRLADALRS